MTLGIDYAGGRPNAAEIRTSGYAFVVRYLSDGGPGLPGKLLTPEEADALRAAGVDIVSNWETTADRLLGGHDAGVADAQAALAQVLACGGRPDRPIYFSADWDATEGDQQAIDDYLRGAGTVIGPEWVGIYGGYWPVSRALDHGSARWAWQTDAWSGSNTEPRAQLHQRAEQVTIDGVQCDVNEALADDYGQWSATTAPAPVPGPPPVTGPLDVTYFDGFMGNVVSDIKDIRQQLTGGRDRVDTATGVDERASYPGWAQLGKNPDGSDRTIVDAVAAVLKIVEAQTATIAWMAAKIGPEVQA
ncbi:glycoside hydrolase domain-containing protein [Nocardia sp. NPDC059228]|uniref:glycoside hydrolase domain-containing protein n=1 Tax=Nocardia sp. NPDC059228 TaxID=3346777 RepID=UPI0036B8E04B